MKEKKNRDGKGENIWSAEEKKNREGKGGKNLSEKEKVTHRRNCEDRTRILDIFGFF